MAVNWEEYAEQAALALQEDGGPALVYYSDLDPEASYNITTGKDYVTETVKETHAILTNFEADAAGEINPEDILIIFHPGFSPELMPDLLDKEDVKIGVGSKIYKVINLKAIRPNGTITLLYKAQASEFGDELDEPEPE